MIHEVYIVDLVDYPATNDVLQDNVCLLRGCLRGYSFNRYVALHYMEFMQLLLKGLCTFKLYGYNVNASEDIDTKSLIQYATLMHNDRIHSEFQSCELTVIDEYETDNGFHWYATASLVSYCSDYLFDDVDFVEFILGALMNIPEYLSRPIKPTFQNLSNRIIGNIERQLASMDASYVTKPVDPSNISWVFDEVGIVYWIIATKRFLRY